MANEAKRVYRRDAHRRFCLGHNGELPCMCWCQRKIVHVDRADVLQGLTESCGRTGCSPKAVAA